jgi:hypothetical protein
MPFEIPTMYDQDICDYLEAAGYTRTDQHISVDFMEWKKDKQLIRFEGTILKAITAHDRWNHQTTHTLDGFKSTDFTLFVILISCWGIISFESMRQYRSREIL